MVSREEVLKAIIEITGGDQEKEFTRNAVKERLHTSSRQVDRIISELESEGIIVLFRQDKRGSKYYKLARRPEEIGQQQGGQHQTEIQQEAKVAQGVAPTDGTIKILRDLLDEYFERFNEELRKLFEQYLGKPRPQWTERDLDKMYDQIKNNSGLTSIEYLRQQMGMSLEEFLARFREYIIKNYELYPGGKEGIVINGTLYGIIRRKR